MLDCQLQNSVDSYLDLEGGEDAQPVMMCGGRGHPRPRLQDLVLPQAQIREAENGLPGSHNPLRALKIGTRFFFCQAL